VRFDKFIGPVVARGADVFVEVDQSVRFEGSQNGPKQTLEIRHMMQRLMEEDDVVLATRESRKIEIGYEIPDSANAFGRLNFSRSQD